MTMMALSFLFAASNRSLLCTYLVKFNMFDKGRHPREAFQWVVSSLALTDLPLNSFLVDAADAASHSGSLVTKLLLRCK